MMAKEFLSQRRIPFEYVDVNTLDDPTATLRAITGGPIATPVVVVGDEHRVGFDPEWMDDAIARNLETKAATRPKET